MGRGWRCKGLRAKGEESHCVELEFWRVGSCRSSNSQSGSLVTEVAAGRLTALEVGRPLADLATGLLVRFPAAVGLGSPHEKKARGLSIG